jgi:hypothetical protein
MGRANYTFRETTMGKKQTLNPIWRGVGFIILVALTVGAFWLAGYLLELHWQQPFAWVPFDIPRNFTVQFHRALPVMPGKLLVQLGFALLIDLLGYALMVLVYSIFNPIRPGKTDAPQPRGRGRHSMTR